jgi:hypothetical protein
MNGVITLGAQMIFNIFKKMNNNDKQPEANYAPMLID